MIIKKLILTIITIFILSSISIADVTPVSNKTYVGDIDDVKCYLEFGESTFGPCCGGKLLIYCDNSHTAYYYHYEQPENERLVKIDTLGYLYQTAKDKLIYFPDLTDYAFTTSIVKTTD